MELSIARAIGLKRRRNYGTMMFPELPRSADVSAVADSESAEGKTYSVNGYHMTCTCADFIKRRSHYPRLDARRLCKHQVTALINNKDTREVVGDLGYAVLRLAELRKPPTGYYTFRTDKGMVLVAERLPLEWVNVFTPYDWPKDADGYRVWHYGYNIMEKRWAYRKEPVNSDEIAWYIDTSKPVLPKQGGRWMNKWAGVAALVLLSVVAFAAAGPFITASELKAGIVEKDPDKLSRNIDFDRLRQGLKEQYHTKMLKEAVSNEQMGGFEALGSGLAVMMINTVLEMAVTPSGIAALMSGGDLDSDAASQSQSDNNPRFDDASFSMESLSQVYVHLPNEDGTVSKVVLERNGFTWKMVNLIVPN